MKFLCIVLISVLSSAAFAQQQQNANLDLAITWQPLENNYLKDEQGLSKLTIKNVGNATLPKTGWKLFFNFIRVITPKTANQPFEVAHLNGDLSCFTPAKNFEGLKPGESLTFEMLSNSWMVNTSDAPQGFYLVWDKTKEILPFKAVAFVAPPDQKKFFRVGGDVETTSEMIYSVNQNIADVSESKLTKVFPTPVSYAENGKTLTLTSNLTIGYEAGFENEANLLAQELSKLFGKKINVNKLSNVKPTISLLKDGATHEAYTLNITEKGVVIKAGSSAGAFYGIQSLKTLINPAAFASNKNKSLVLTGVDVTDAPRFGYRGFMLDVARNFQPKAQILKLLDVFALYKINTLHFHLNDDEGWRLEIPTLPELTNVGAKRANLNGSGNTLQPAYGSGPYADQLPGSGYYSKEDFKEILRYATARHIRVIPEIETPGHARAAIKAMDKRYQTYLAKGDKAAAEKYLLRHLEDKSVYRSVQKWNDNVVDVAMPSVYSFLETVTDDIIAMYKEAGAPLETIHFGGDEVPKGVWEQSPAFNALKQRDNNIKTTTDLWDFYFGKVSTMLKKKGLYLSGWEEVGLTKAIENGKSKWLVNGKFANQNVHVNVWNNLLGNEDLAYRLANGNYKVIISFVSTFYFDMAYFKKFEEPGFYWGGFTELDKPFSFIPYDYLKNQQKNYLGRQLSEKVLNEAEKLTAPGKNNIVGLQGQLWSETIKNADNLEYLLLPRLLALAERAWSASPDWAEEGNEAKARQLYENSLSNFYNSLGKRELKRLNYYAGGFNYRIPTPGLKVKNGKIEANVQLPGFTIRYATDGSTPTLKSPVYSHPVSFSDQIVFRTFDHKGNASSVSTPTK
ncbi:family 20 glycosylhydrolase [Pedobacter sp. SL55]|uniref:family 20 glycosylhydrolase n=1 Tax=Pedobacter sp. SL55 TaxID=2995161 RepID=UPI002270F48D|nr:family 20 glycosylhydrolase [Pedobacter sp. SL55]WAC39680.1 carbohydate-binding domain-containing protein [Pedobacter sp. SL55]